MWVLAAAAAFAGCPKTNAELEPTLQVPVDAYVDLDLDRFRQAMAQVEVGCLHEVISPSVAAQLHLNHALSAFVEKDFGLAENHFGSVRTLRRRWVLPDVLAPVGHPLSKRSLAVDLNVGLTPVPVPRRGSYRVDGATREAFDPRLPFVLQRVTPKGVVRSTTLMPPNSSIPVGESVRDRPPVLLISGLASVGMGLGAYGGALGAKSAYESKTSGTAEEFDRLFRLNQGLTVAGVGLTSLGTGLLVAHLFRR